MKFLFICKHNRFRSKIAESWFNKLNNGKHEVKSSGLLEGSYPLEKSQVRVAKRLGVPIDRHPKATSTKLLDWADYIIIVANDVPKELFEGYNKKAKRIVWKIEDKYNDNENNIERIINEVGLKVKNLMENLE
ncbi:hypothetical protein AUJ84_03570 [Candidatus Pacearchaeota archaeon CG1_02_32_132]|nr:MAG: hypothetical protein AUJ84_03570 [Candidatus Pacearchaeota archaeon CG1_02_32_132]